MAQNVPGTRYDLHSHTTASDGVLSPADLVRRAVLMGVDVLAISDHDTLSGLAEARETIEQEQLPLCLIPAVEISTAWEGEEIHIVGLNVNVDNDALQTLLEQQSESRRQRARQMAHNLGQQLNRPELYEQVRQQAGEGAITRAHFARYLLQERLVSSLDQAFAHYLGSQHPAYVQPGWCTIAVAIEAIRGSGGKAVLAHPARYGLKVKQLRKLLLEFKQAGGQAMEVAHCQQNQDERLQLAKYASEFQLQASLGSDFHHPCAWLELGRNLWLPGGGTPVWYDWALCLEE
ncbi:MAG: RNase RNM [Enterobacteriaceae bacterium]